ncbi:MAG: DUF503 domain-containing protein [Eubacteriales bacterium]
MVTVICQVELKIFEANSLKDKRSVLRSIIEKIKNKNNISVIESDFQDFWQKSKIGLSFCSVMAGDAHKKVENVLSSIESNPYVEIIHIDKEEVYI